ncbi:MAG: hypothetical protein KGH79_03650 [Patescibacteria group bacterium]|nr:hypothetical protein [Patescibacteria group bacterium]
MYVTLLLLAGGALLTLGDVVFKYWLLHPHSLLYVAGLVLYLGGLIFLIASYRYQNIAVASAMLVLFNIATLALVSWLYFKEPLSYLQIGGLLVAAVAIILLEAGS